MIGATSSTHPLGRSARDPIGLQLLLHAADGGGRPGGGGRGGNAGVRRSLCRHQVSLSG